MKTKLTRMLALLLAIVMLVAVAAPLVACGGGGGKGNGDDGGKPGGEPGGEPCAHVDADDNGKCDKCSEDFTDGNDTPPPVDGKTTYSVYLHSAAGMPFSEIAIYIYDEDGAYVDRATTDDNGMISVELDTGNYTIEVESGDLPAGYKVQSSYPLDENGTEIKLASAPIEGDLSDTNGYKLGDVVHDFSLTDIDGNTYKVSEVLETNKVLVLNFWYTTCTWCLEEFPYLASAYDKYADQGVALFAINDYALDSLAAVQNFVVYNRQDEPVELNFPLFKVDETIIGKFDTTTSGYPVTVAIDRYGVICMVQIGGVPSEKYFTNMFDHFLAENYEQKLVTSINEFAPSVKPDVDMPSSDAINEVVSGNNMNGNPLEVTFRPEDDEYSWPFIISEFDGYDVIRPSNFDQDNSYSILYADVYLEAGEALLFDYFSSNEYDYDFFHIIVDNEPIYSITGINDPCGEDITDATLGCKNHADTDSDGKCDNLLWLTCGAYVAQSAGYYEVAFVYIKDISGYDGDDTVYIKNLRGVPASELDELGVEAHIFREAATQPNDWDDGFDSYVELVLNEEDGYLHVGSANGPLLLANLLGYTQFDPQATVFERFYATAEHDEQLGYILMVDGKNMGIKFDMHGNYAKNSTLYGYTPVTPELRDCLKAYVELCRTSVAPLAKWDYAGNPDLWLALCVYYDAYGTNGKQLEDPIKGLSSFSAHEAVVGKGDVENNINTLVFTAGKIILPRGYLFEFTPEQSGAYRITTNSVIEKPTIGWIFTGNHYDDDWSVKSRPMYAESTAIADRIIEELVVISHYTVICDSCGATLNLGIDKTAAVCTDLLCGNIMENIPDEAKTPVLAKDESNCTMAVYLEAGETYYICLAYFYTEESGTFSFDLDYLGESYSSFVSLAPGGLIGDVDGGGNLTGGGVVGGRQSRLCTVDGCEECARVAEESGAPEGTKYYHVVNGNTQGSIVYADFTLTTGGFPNQSLLDILAVDGFNLKITTADRQGRQYLSDMIRVGKTALFALWDEEADEPLTNNAKNQRWAEYCLEEILWNKAHDLEGDMLAQAEEWAEFVIEQGKEYYITRWGDDFDDTWAQYQMDDIINGIYHGNGTDYTEDIEKYLERMYTADDYYELQGCIAVDAELQQILSAMMVHHGGTRDGWRQLCYYYNPLIGR